MGKRTIYSIVLSILIISSTAWAGQFGAPEPVAKDGRGSMGIGYFYFQNEMKPDDSVNFKETKVKQQQMFVQFSAAANRVEGYVRIGGARLKVDDAFVTTFPNTTGFKSDFDDSGVLFGTIGARGVFDITPNFGIGLFFQASLSDNYEDSTTGAYLGVPITQKLKYKTPWEIAGGLAFQGKFDQLIVYAGPFLYNCGSEVEATATAPTLGVQASQDTNYKSKSNFGGFGGLRFIIGKGFSIELEGQYINDWSAGGLFAYSF